MLWHCGTGLQPIHRTTAETRRLARRYCSYVRLGKRLIDRAANFWRSAVMINCGKTPRAFHLVLLLIQPSRPAQRRGAPWLYLYDHLKSIADELPIFRKLLTLLQGWCRDVDGRAVAAAAATSARPRLNTHECFCVKITTSCISVDHSTVQYI